MPPSTSKPHDAQYYGGAGDDEDLVGGNGSDTIYGGTDEDYIYGNAGADTLFGGDGDFDDVDRRDGVEGNDFVSGGPVQGDTIAMWTRLTRPTTPARASYFSSVS